MKTEILLIFGGLAAAAVAAFLFLKRGTSAPAGNRNLGGGGSSRTPNTQTASQPNSSFPGLNLNVGGFTNLAGNGSNQFASMITGGTKALTDLWKTGSDVFKGSTKSDIGAGVAVPTSFFEPGVQSVDLAPVDATYDSGWNTGFGYVESSPSYSWDDGYMGAISE